MVCNEREWVNGGLWQSEITIKQTKDERIVDGKMKCYKNAWRAALANMKKRTHRKWMERRQSNMPGKNPIWSDFKWMQRNLFLVDV